MSEITRLLRVAARRNRADEYTQLRIRILKTDLAELREQLAEDNMTINVFIESMISGYVGRHPSVLALIDDRRREIGKPDKTSCLDDHDIDDIYAAVGGGTIEEDD